MDNLFEFIAEYGLKIAGLIVSLITYIIAWRSGKKSGSSSLLRDLRKLEKIEKDINKEN